ncbi:hypothetical protein [Sporosarcina sp. FA15]|uniref:hypothetical protein n=1 Tax=Sporosarcina sp. FA15 TaxID=3413031 RepID=UPI003F6599F1
MNKHHTITEKMCRNAMKSHSYTSRHLGNRIEVVQSKAIQKSLYTKRLVLDLVIYWLFLGNQHM